MVVERVFAEVSVVACWADLTTSSNSRYNQEVHTPSPNLVKAPKSGSSIVSIWGTSFALSLSLRTVNIETTIRRPHDISRRLNESEVQFKHRESLSKVGNSLDFLARTGDDAHLSSLVGLQPLREVSEALGLNRADIKEYSEDVICVSLRSAERFLFSPLGWEKDAFPHLRAKREELEEERGEGCEQWVERVLSHAQDVSINVNGFT
ncbi:hypothetical protein SAMD00023353_1800720 [Rosellinia necatrix]|uniref:Uncharacterized protein n=1 Tax=Rosellinia necatrix TaxID=77044 RepID=A0A1W2TEB2_ROSNE|nr:hypothetical protein SAMD00023353_1800720 [Rosellinia necatrix]